MWGVATAAAVLVLTTTACADEFGNPEHRIDKIGELVATESR